MLLSRWVLRMSVSWWRRAGALLLVWLVVLPLAVIAPARSAAAQVGTTQAAFVAGERLAGGSSLSAGHIGLNVTFRELPSICEQERFRGYGICATGPNQRPTPTPSPTPTPVPTPDYAQLKASAYTQARTELLASMPTPEMRLWPAVDRFQIVNLETYLFVEHGWTDVAGQGRACDADQPSECVVVSLSGRPERSTWRFVEANGASPPVEVECERGERQPTDDDEIPACGKTWTHSSDVTGEVTAELSISYNVAVNTSHAGYLPHLNLSFDVESTRSDVETLTVAEVQTYGHSDVDPVPEESNGGLCSKWGISVVCWVGSKAKDAAIWAVVNLVPGLEDVWNFFKGCSDGALDALGGVLDILTTIKDAVSRPADFATEKLRQIQDLFAAAEEDPERFIAEVLAGVVDLEYRENHSDAEWVGKMVCQYAIDILTGKAGAALLAKLDRFLGRGRSGNNSGGSDADSATPRVCTRESSFPTGTEVRMASGALRAIEDIVAGDYVLAGDPATGQWSPQRVITQWSYVDTDNMTTATLVDGTQVTATDHHLFWVASTGAWVELENTKPGDRLLSPQGSTVVGHVVTHTTANTLVWELDTAGPNTFTVHTGSYDLLVHNEDGCGVPGSRDHREAHWERAEASGMTRAEFDRRYDDLGGNIDKIPDGAEVVGFDPVTGQPVVYKGPDGRYVDIRTPEQRRARASEIVGEAGDRRIALGRQDDTDLAPANGDFHLAVEDWSQELNDAFIDDIIANDVPIRVVSDPDEKSNLVRNNGEPTVFALEMQQLREAGVEIVYARYE